MLALAATSPLLEHGCERTASLNQLLASEAARRLMSRPAADGLSVRASTRSPPTQTTHFRTLVSTSFPFP